MERVLHPAREVGSSMTGREYFEYLQSFDYLLAQAEINPPSQVDVCQLRRFKVAIENARPQLEKMKDPDLRAYSLSILSRMRAIIAKYKMLDSSLGN